MSTLHSCPEPSRCVLCTMCWVVRRPNDIRSTAMPHVPVECRRGAWLARCDASLHKGYASIPTVGFLERAVM
jgi:hypothetical protein